MPGVVLQSVPAGAVGRLLEAVVLPVVTFGVALAPVVAVAGVAGRRLGARPVALALLAVASLVVGGVTVRGLTGPLPVVGVVVATYAATRVALYAGPGRVAALVPALAGLIAAGGAVVAGRIGFALAAGPALGLSPLLGSETGRPGGRPVVVAGALLVGYGAGLVAATWPVIAAGASEGLVLAGWLLVAPVVAAACGPLLAAGAAHPS